MIRIIFSLCIFYRGGNQSLAYKLRGDNEVGGFLAKVQFWGVLSRRASQTSVISTFISLSP